MTTVNFSEVYSMFYKRLFQIGYSITRDVHLAEDVVQETFIKAIKKSETIEDESKVGAWLSVIATRTAIDFVRSERKKKGILMEQDMLECLGKEMKQNVEEEVESGMMHAEINNAFQKLKLDYQDVLVLKIGQGLKEQEIAEVLELNAATVKTRIYRGRKLLKHFFLQQQSGSMAF
jgi:RNA polymerase sigma-70 factor (ECF subfamily)